MLVPSFSRGLFEPKSILANYEIPTMRLLAQECEPAQGQLRAPKIRMFIIKTLEKSIFLL